MFVSAYFKCCLQHLPVSWLNGSAFVSGAGGPSFKSRVGQIIPIVANDSPPLQHFRNELCFPSAMTRIWAPPTHYTLRRTTASTMKEESCLIMLAACVFNKRVIIIYKRKSSGPREEPCDTPNSVLVKSRRDVSILQFKHWLIISCNVHGAQKNKCILFFFGVWHRTFIIFFVQIRRCAVRTAQVYPAQHANISINHCHSTVAIGGFFVLMNFMV